MRYGDNTREQMQFTHPCPWPTRCRCNHQQCDRGWMTVEILTPDVVTGGQVIQEQVKRCPQCSPPPEKREPLPPPVLPEGVTRLTDWRANAYDH